MGALRRLPDESQSQANTRHVIDDAVATRGAISHERSARCRYSLVSVRRTSHVQVTTDEHIALVLKTVDSIQQLLEGCGFLLNLVPLLLYADDIILLARNAKELQEMLCVLQGYARKWRFQVNKTKERWSTWAYRAATRAARWRRVFGCDAGWHDRVVVFGWP